MKELGETEFLACEAAKAHGVKGKQEREREVYEDVPLFKPIMSSGQRNLLKEKLKVEHFVAGDVIFNYGKQHTDLLLITRVTGDYGDKFYILLSGEVTMELPTPSIPPEEFKKRYANYKRLLEHMEVLNELDRKEEIVKARKRELQPWLVEAEAAQVAETATLALKATSVLQPRVENEEDLKKAKELAEFSRGFSCILRPKKGASFEIQTSKDADRADKIYSDFTTPASFSPAGKQSSTEELWQLTADVKAIFD